VERLDQFPALQQRVVDPGPGYGFFEGNTLAPRIDLTFRGNPERELRAIGLRLTELLYQHAARDLGADQQRVRAIVAELAREIADADPTSANRRTMVKRTCAMLIRLHDEGVLDTGEVVRARGEEWDEA
jgi:hypothetical protein